MTVGLGFAEDGEFEIGAVAIMDPLEPVLVSGELLFDCDPALLVGRGGGVGGGGFSLLNEFESCGPLGFVRDVYDFWCGRGGEAEFFDTVGASLSI